MMMWLGIVQKVKVLKNKRKKRIKQGGFFWKKVGGAIGICNRKTKDFLLDTT
jgi:hypothetical protein